MKRHIRHSLLLARIITYRETHGKFKSLEELRDIEGIGPVTIEKIKDRMLGKFGENFLILNL